MVKIRRMKFLTVFMRSSNWRNMESECGQTELLERRRWRAAPFLYRFLEKRTIVTDLEYMMAKKYYAVAQGREPGIYDTWHACKEQIDHYSGAVYKSFTTRAEAESFVAENGIKQREHLTVSTKDHLVAYVDGSYAHGKRQYAYGCVLILEEEVITLNGSGSEEAYVSMRNVAGEILGSEQAVLWAIDHGYAKITIYYDYEGIEKWANGIWKANKEGTQRYQAFIAKKRQQIEILFQKVAAHTGVQYNEMADQLAKEALGLSVG